MREASTRADRVLDHPAAGMLAWLAAIIEDLFVFPADAKYAYESNPNPAGLLVRRLRPAPFFSTCHGANHWSLQGRTSSPVHHLHHVRNGAFVHLSAERPRPAISSGGVRMRAAGRVDYTKGFDGAGGARE